MSRCYRVAAGCLLALLLAGCQGMGLLQGNDAGEDRPTLADLERAPTTVPVAPAEPVTRDQVIARYRDLLPLLEDPRARMRVERRLADLGFDAAEARLADEAVDELDDPIANYRALLERYPRQQDNDEVHYQLARVFDLRGDPEAQLQALDRIVADHPGSDLWLEAQFRRGEILFSEGRYRDAAAAYDAVIGAGEGRGESGRFVTNALYMKGWCQFRLGAYEQALLSYSGVLDRLLPEARAVASIDREHQALVEDLFRVMGLSFSYLGGADSVPALFQAIGDRHYEILVYDRYSDLLLAREQYSDAIAVYQRFIDEHPRSRWAPRYHMNILATLERAGFRQDLPRRQAEFVGQYGINSGYWQQAEETVRAYLREQLETLLPALGNRQFRLAGDSTEPQQRRQAYAAAARYYGEFADTFPSHDRTPEMLFLMAEAHLKLSQWSRAIAAFERAAYDFGNHDRAAEAGYAAVLAYRDYAAAGSGRPQQEQQALAADQQLNRQRFAQVFPQDERAPAVLHAAIRHDYEAGNHGDVVIQARQLLGWQPPAPADIRAGVTLLQAHSLYARGDFRGAEAAYDEALAQLPAGDPRRDGIPDNLAASVYRQAEERLARGDKAGAVAELLRVGDVAPGSPLRTTAEYDAIGHLMALQDWQGAIEVMSGFRQRYPGHELTATLPAKLALAYRETGQLALAAGELTRLAESSDSDDDKRENLLLAADLYDQAGDRGEAIARYRQYANAYPRPAEDYMEAANRLAQLYAGTGQPAKRVFWLERMVQALDRDRPRASERMTYLAARASADLAGQAWESYQAIDLTLPLQRSLRAKIQALDKAASAYERTAGYGVAEFATEAGYRIAALYGQLGADLMASERPDGLSELELAQYELLLEEQAYPFEDDAIDIHEQNARRSWNGLYDDWVKRSFDALRSLLPARYDKTELTSGVIDELE